METSEFEKEKAFNTDDITAIIKEAVEGTIGDEPYAHSKAPAWNTTIVEGCLKKLKEKNKDCKYVVTCIILQKKGGGFYAGSTVYWDNENDASASYRYESKTVHAIVNVFALSL